MFKTYLKLNYLLATISLVIGVVIIAGNINSITLIVALYYFLTAFLIIKKPRLGRILLFISLVLFGVAMVLIKLQILKSPLFEVDTIDL